MNAPSIRDRIKEILMASREGHPVDDLLEEFVIIHRDALPEFKVIERNGKQHVDCGSDWGTWDVAHVNRMRTTALEYVGAWLTAEKWHAERESSTKARRDELAAEFGYALPHFDKFSPLSRAIDRIIELERKAA